MTLAAQCFQRCFSRLSSIKEALEPIIHLCNFLLITFATSLVLSPLSIDPFFSQCGHSDVSLGRFPACSISSFILLWFKGSFSSLSPRLYPSDNWRMRVYSVFGSFTPPGIWALFVPYNSYLSAVHTEFRVGPHWLSPH